MINRSSVAQPVEQRPFKSRVAGSTPAGGTNQTPIPDNWLTQIPELATRTNLCRRMLSLDSLRRAVFNIANDFENTALIPDPSTAKLCLTLLFHHSLERIESHWRNRLSPSSNENDLIYSELYGVVRNIYKNMFVKVTGLHLMQYNPHDIRRLYKF